MKAFWKFLERRADACIAKRPADVIIGRKNAGGEYLQRWYLLPRNPLFNIYVHKFVGSDVAFALHDHPWLFNVSYIWSGHIYEWEPEPNILKRQGMATACRHPIRRLLTQGTVKFRWGRSPHRLQLLRLRNSNILLPTYTIFLTGPRVRDWGFWCPKGWISFSALVKKTGKDVNMVKECP